MVSASLVDALSAPTDALIDLYASAVKDGTFSDFPAVVSKHFAAVFASADAFSQIPVLDVAQPPATHVDRALVQFSAMVQDTSCSSEMYLSVSERGECGGWSLEDDHLLENMTAFPDASKLRERSVLWAVNIPGQAGWAQGAGAANGDAHSTQLTAHKFPIPGATHVAAQVKIYDDSAESLKPTDIACFVGILTSEQLHSEFAEPALVHTLHVLFHRPLPRLIMPRPLMQSSLDALEMRTALINWLATEALGGDHDAAEWVLLGSIASVQSRSPPILPLSITISHFPVSLPFEPNASTNKPETRSPTLSHALAELLPISVQVPLTLSALNAHAFRPTSVDEDLHAGFLQLPAGTVILAAEVGVEEGKLEEKGLRNVQALQSVVQQQTLHYSFPFTSYAFPTDLSVIVLSEGKKSLFCDTTVVVPLQPHAHSDLYKPRESLNLPPPTQLQAIRELVLLAKSRNATIGEDVSEYVQAEFVNERRQNSEFTTDDLIRRMTIARLMALSRGETEITKDAWTLAKDLDVRRCARSA